MKKRKFILGFMIILEIFLILVIINKEKSRYVYKKHVGIVNNIQTRGKIIKIHSEGDFYLICLKVEDSNYREYRKESNEFFIRVKDSLAVIASDQPYEVGSELLINKQIIELEEGDTISKNPIKFYSIGDYLKNSCIPD